MRILSGLIADIVAAAVVTIARLVTAVRAEWRGGAPSPAPRIYIANHASHGDFALLWTVLPPVIRQRTRPVAAADYWLRGPVRRFLMEQVFHAVLIDRHHQDDEADPIELMGRALDAGDSLILFPEGTRNTTSAALLPLKSGLYRLMTARPGVECVPVWINNLNRVLPKGEWLPVPLLCTVTFGPPMTVLRAEGQVEFMERARRALLELTGTTELNHRAAET